MGLTILNSETGEFEIYRSDKISIKPQTFDEETGEPLNDQFKIRYEKHISFQIPRKLLRGTPCEEIEKRIDYEYMDQEDPPTIIPIKEEAKATKKMHSQSYKRKDYMNMEGVNNEIILGYSKTRFHLFLMPSLFCFNIYFAIVMMLTETILHYWSHIKNGLNMNKNIYYRSPLHILTSQYCAICRSETEMELKIFKMLNHPMRKPRKSLSRYLEN